VRSAVTSLGVVLAAALLATASASAGGPLETAVFDPAAANGSFSASALQKVRAAGATMVRVPVDWAAVAPAGEKKPAFDAGDPDDPAYRWQGVDRVAKLAAAAGLEPLLSLTGAPAWAQRASPPQGLGANHPDAVEFGRFAEAIAKRFSGRHQGLPRVRYWQAWNEPNLATYLWPQLEQGKPVSPGVYRDLVNALADAVKSVHADNLVVAGGLAPFRDITPDTLSQDKDWGPLSFMRDLLCLSSSLRPTCHERIRFDIWSTHPYTSGGPTHHAVLPNDVSLGDLPKMRKVLDAAASTGVIRSRGPVRFWVTEFSWDSNPPDPHGVPVALLKRWVPHALYEMWRSGVSMVTWFQLRDDAPTTSFYQAGLYDGRGRAKAFREAFRFPFVAFPQGNGVYAWGRTPWGKPGVVAVEQRAKGGPWKPLGNVRSNRYGVFEGTFRTGTTGFLRARLLSTGERSAAFSLAEVPDQFFNPFGQTTLLEPGKGEKS